MRKIGIWASGLIASAIPFVFVGAVIVFGACIFEAVGQHAQPAFHLEDGPAEQVQTVASADEHQPNKRQAGKHSHGDARHHHAQSRSNSRARYSWLFNPYQWGTSESRFALGLLTSPTLPKHTAHTV
jgi:hypothetical protein